MEPLLRKIGRRGGLFGLFFSRPLYETTTPVELDDEIVPAGFITDLVSSPWWGRPFLPRKKMQWPALRHDMRLTLQKWKSRTTINAQFYSEMLEEGVPKFIAWVAWRAVELNLKR